jgi:hypothetical protein
MLRGLRRTSWLFCGSHLDGTLAILQLKMRTAATAAKPLDPKDVLFYDQHNPYFRDTVLKFSSNGRTYILAGVNHMMPWASSEQVLRLLEREQPNSVVLEIVYPKSVVAHLPPRSSRRRISEFLSASEWAYHHKAALYEAEPWHANYPFENFDRQKGTTLADIRWGNYTRATSLPSGSDQNRSSKKPSLARSILQVVLGRLLTVPLRWLDSLTRGHPAPRHLMDAYYFQFPLKHSYGYQHAVPNLERELFFIKQLQEAKGSKVVGVFGAKHLSGIIHLWNEYERTPYDTWRKTIDGGKDFSFEICKKHKPSIEEWEFNETKRRKKEWLQGIRTSLSGSQ